MLPSAGSTRVALQGPQETIMLTLYGTLLQPRSPADCDITPKSIVRIADDGTIDEVASGNAPAGDTIGDDGCWMFRPVADTHADGESGSGGFDYGVGVRRSDAGQRDAHREPGGRNAWVHVLVGHGRDDAHARRG